MSNDPIGISGGLNQYVFCGGNPVSFTDPDGLSYAELYAGYGAVAGGGVVAVGSIAVDAVTGGLNILATPAEIGAGAAIGGTIGYGIGSVLDLIMPQSRTPARGRPSSRETFPDERGGRTDREYGPDGRAHEDTDYGHDHGAGDPHKHKWDWGKKPPRQPGTPMPGLLPFLIKQNPYDEDPCK